MTSHARLFTILLFSAAVAGLVTLGAQVSRPLTVISAGPSGESATLAEANQVRVVFSEPMVALGRIPDPVPAPFFRITPAVRGTFRWSGTTILIFTPDPAVPLPYATRFDVTIDDTATALSGNRVRAPYSFSFTTPTARLLATRWYRKSGRYDSPLVVALRFNQPVRPAEVRAHLTLRDKPHTWERPSLSIPALDRLRRLEPAGLALFNAKLSAADAAARSEAPVSAMLASEWDREKYPASPDLVVLETTSVPPPESWIELTLDDRLPAVGGPATPGSAQRYTLELEPAFFVKGPFCVARCDPSSGNGIQLTRDTPIESFANGTLVADITEPGEAAPIARVRAPGQRNRSWQWDESPAPTLEDAGFDRQPPARTYAIRVDPSVQAVDGQRLGYPWIGIVENWHERAFTSFGDGHGVWERGNGRQLPFHARNFLDVTQWAAPLSRDRLMPTILSLQDRFFRQVPDGPGDRRRLSTVPDEIRSYGLDLSRAINSSGTGLAWAAVEEGQAIERADSGRNDTGEPARKSTIVQVTNLGVSVKDSPQSTLVFVTALDSGEPVSGARVSIITRDNEVFWSGLTNGDGLAVAPDTALRDATRYWRNDLEFIIVAEKNGDVAYVGSDWNEGIHPWEFGYPYSLDEAAESARGTVFADRGVYRPGEEVRVKAILRADSSAGVRLLPAGTDVVVTIRDSQDREVDRRTVKAGDWSSAEWTYRVPLEASLGTYSMRATFGQPAVRDLSTLEPRMADAARERDEARRSVHGSFLVAAYRRPDFRVDVTLTGAAPLAGATLTGRVDARYLFGGAMMNRPVKWTLTRDPVFSVPDAIEERYPANQHQFVGYRDVEREANPVAADETALDPQGRMVNELATELSAGLPYEYTFEADIEDVSRQHIANRATWLVHPAPWYIGLKQPRGFVDPKTGLDTEIVVVAPTGVTVSDVQVDLTLYQVQWNSARRAEGGGFYTWETERREIESGRWQVVSRGEPSPLSITVPAGGAFVIKATARDAEGRVASTHLPFQAIGDGYTAWQRFDHNRIELESERRTYKPGETVRVMVRSPWERATALVTTEREGIRSHRRFRLTSTQQTIEIPVTERDIPNVFVSVLLIKGRTPGPSPEDGSDPGKPAFRLGYLEILVDDGSKRLTATVSANREEYRPANTARVSVEVRDAQRRGVASEVTLWAVDRGVLSLTDYRLPDVASRVYTRKPLQVMTADSRQRIVSRRVLTPKGTEEGGGGGVDAGGSAVRRDFRALAFWLGSVTTGANGRASVDVELPESLTTYRIMAIAADRASRFGNAESEIRISKPVTLTASYPRFLTPGDQAFFGAVVTNQLPEPGTAVVTMRSLDPGVVQIDADAERSVEIPAGGAVEVRFDASARSLGRARVQMAVRIGSETDAFEDVIAVNLLSTPETVAAYGETTSDARETLSPPPGAVPGIGGLRLELSSTAMVGLGEGARYLVDYPYGCAEQRASSALAIVLAADLGEAFSLPGIAPSDLRARAQATLRELEAFQCANGGFAYWPGACFSTSPYLTSYILHVMRVADSLGYTVSADARTRGYLYLERALNQPPAENEGWTPGYTAWQAFAVKVLVEGGRPQDSNINRLFGYLDRMPIFAIAHLHDALVAKAEAGARRDELRRRMTNAILSEGGSAHVEELSDPYLLWFWNSNVRSTAIALGSIARVSEGDAALALIRPLVRWMMTARTDGRWGNTQENAWAMESLTAYYRKFERQVPDFSAVVALGVEEVARATFQGRSSRSVVQEVPAPRLPAPSAGVMPLEIRKVGTGTLFYGARLRYALDPRGMDEANNGFALRRAYTRIDNDGVEGPPATTFNAGELVRVTLTFTLPQERRFVAVTDPLPAGFEPLESWFRTTASALLREQQSDESAGEWREWWRRGGFDHVERHDDRVLLFGTRLAEGVHEFSYVVRATTAGVFQTAPAHVEEMYEPEVFGRTASAVIRVTR